MDKESYDRLVELLRKAGAEIIPAWITEAVLQKNPNLTLQLANSRQYQVEQDNVIIGYEN